MAATQVVYALLTAIGWLEEIERSDPESSMPGNAIEGVAYQLGQMDLDERRRFLAAVETVAAMQERDGNSDLANWMRGIPAALGLTVD